MLSRPMYYLQTFMRLFLYALLLVTALVLSWHGGVIPAVILYAVGSVFGFILLSGDWLRAEPSHRRDFRANSLFLIKLGAGIPIQVASTQMFGALLLVLALYLLINFLVFYLYHVQYPADNIFEINYQAYVQNKTGGYHYA